MRLLKKLKHHLEITKASIGIIPACLGQPYQHQGATPDHGLPGALRGCQSRDFAQQKLSVREMPDAARCWAGFFMG
jgi:hypothetical protein